MDLRPAVLRDAVDSLAEGGAAARGAVFTRPQVVDALLDLAGYVPARPLHLWRLLEPACGAGDFLLPAVERLLTAATAAGLGPGSTQVLAPAIRAVEVHAESLAAARSRVSARLVAWGMDEAGAAALCDAWLVRDDFLLAPLAGAFDVVVGNPPYVRQERIPGPLLAEYRRRYATLYDRADLYVPFFERGLRLLAPGGRLAFICADRWLKNRYGGPLRALIASEFHLSHYIDMQGTDAFQASVDAYPAITVIARAPAGTTRIARRPEVVHALPAVVRSMLGEVDDPRVEAVERAVVGDEPWLLGAEGPLRVLRRLERDFSPIEAAGCKVGIGVASGADRVFIAPDEALPVEPARKLPLVMAGDLQGASIAWSGSAIVNPFEPDGSLARLEDYPRFAAYVRAHAEALARRYVARRNPEGWYRTIDRIDPGLTATPKLLIPDIKGEPVVALDRGGYYPHHNLYFVTASAWDLAALATILRSSVARLFVAAYGVTMAGGFLRFQAQYLRRIRVPRWEALSAGQRAALVEADPRDRAAIDRAAFLAYGLGADEAAAVREARALAR